MKTHISHVLLGGLVIAALSLPALARGGGGGGGGASGGGGFSHGSPSGPGSNSAASSNSNGRFATDRDKGRERAEDRMSYQGLKHQKAGSAPNNQVPPRPEPPTLRPDR